MGARLAIIAVVLALAGCQFVPGQTAPVATGAQALQTSEITVETLAPPGQTTDGKPGPTATATKAPAATEDKAAPTADLPAETQAAPVVKSSSQLACEKQGGVYVMVGKSGAFACQLSTNDAGKSCQNSGECDGSCLARSRSCAPVKPLFGCNEILETDGRRVTLCID